MQNEGFRFASRLLSEKIANKRLKFMKKYAILKAEFFYPLDGLPAGRTAETAGAGIYIRISCKRDQKLKQEMMGKPLEKG